MKRGEAPAEQQQREALKIAFDVDQCEYRFLLTVLVFCIKILSEFLCI